MNSTDTTPKGTNKVRLKINGEVVPLSDEPRILMQTMEFSMVRRALLSAKIHVHRQYLGSDYEQHRADAAAWLDENRELLSELKDGR